MVKGRPVGMKRSVLYVYLLQLFAAVALAGCQGRGGSVVMRVGDGAGVLSDLASGQIALGAFGGATDESAYWAEQVRACVQEGLGAVEVGEACGAGVMVVSGRVSLSRAGGRLEGCGSRVRAEVVFELRKGGDGELVERVLLGRWAPGNGVEGIWYSLSAMAEGYCERIRGGSRVGEVRFAEGRSEYDRLGRRAAALGEWERALRLFRQAVDAQPEDDAALYNSGLVCEGQGDYDQALAYYDRALGVMPRALYAGARNRVRRR